MRNHHGRKERALFPFCLPTTEPEFPKKEGGPASVAGELFRFEVIRQMRKQIESIPKHAMEMRTNPWAGSVRNWQLRLLLCHEVRIWRFRPRRLAPGPIWLFLLARPVL